MKRSRAPRTLLILLFLTGLLGLALYVAYRLATRRSGTLTTDGDGPEGAEGETTGTAAPSADVVDARQPQASAAAATNGEPEIDPAVALADADLESMSREDLYALAEAVGVPARNRLTMTRAQLARTLAEMRDQVTASR
jgi:hypothetical protein